MKKTLKHVFYTMILILLITILVPNIVNAASGQINPDDYIPDPIQEGDNYYLIAGRIVSIVTNIGIIASVLGLTIIGLQTMIGSVEDKAKYKEKMIPAIIGCIIICLTSTIVKVIISLSNSF